MYIYRTIKETQTPNLFFLTTMFKNTKPTLYVYDHSAWFWCIACALLMDLVHGSGASSMVLVHESCPCARIRGIVYSIPLRSCWTTFTYQLRKKMHKQHGIFMANANSTLTRTLYGSHWVCQTSLWVCKASRWVRKASCYVCKALHWLLLNTTMLV